MLSSDRNQSLTAHKHCLFLNTKQNSGWKVKYCKLQHIYPQTISEYVYDLYFHATLDRMSSLPGIDSKPGYCQEGSIILKNFVIYDLFVFLLIKN